ncbi:Pentatricopeptide repeat-containing protein [Turnera subulata]|uniref:Pentatricopeptide repeat-containing protein n=1 Tax=Turnera subulata TaxID=218843 RepID=A0A9Q0F3H1_9ROSI|nr:Pentatricopeptide repeat-containing protein [Turnera subulata]
MDLVAWNSVINGFALNGKPNEALALYREMGLEGVEPDGFTMVSLLSACAELGALALGRRVHVYLVKVGLNENLHVNNALLDLYAKCGKVPEARKNPDYFRLTQFLQTGEPVKLKICDKRLRWA